MSLPSNSDAALPPASGSLRRKYQLLYEAHRISFGKPEDLATLLPKLDIESDFSLDFWALTESVANSQPSAHSREGLIALIAASVGGPGVSSLDSASHQLLDGLGSRIAAHTRRLQPYLEPSPAPLTSSRLHAVQAETIPAPQLFAGMPRSNSQPLDHSDDPARPRLYPTLPAIALLLCLTVAAGVLFRQHAGRPSETADGAENMDGSWTPQRARPKPYSLPVVAGATRRPSPSLVRPGSNPSGANPSGSNPSGAAPSASPGGSAPSPLSPAFSVQTHPAPTFSTQTRNSAVQTATVRIPEPHSLRATENTHVLPEFIGYDTGNGRVTVSSGIMASHLIKSRPPVYPRLARLTHVEGPVVLQAVISRHGNVDHVRVLQGNILLRKATEDAVKKWRYKPFLVDGTPVDVATIVTVDFTRRR